MQSHTQRAAGCDVVDAGIKPDLERVSARNIKVTEV